MPTTREGMNRQRPVSRRDGREMPARHATPQRRETPQKTKLGRLTQIEIPLSCSDSSLLIVLTDEKKPDSKVWPALRNSATHCLLRWFLLAPLPGIRNTFPNTKFAAPGCSESPNTSECQTILLSIATRVLNLCFQEPGKASNDA